MKKLNVRVKRLLAVVKPILLTLIILLFLFSLVSGSNDYGGGIKGILMNSPNSLPWFILLILVLFSWKYEFAGGVIVFLMGIFTIFFFKTLNDLPVFFLISAPLILLGILLIIGSYLKKTH